nr:MaoC family dehydratase N-terminal domain-containing protein [Sphingobium lactosutens]
MTVHWCLAPAIVGLDQTGEDGHPRRGGFLPPVPLPRRMWAGGEVTFDGDIAIGDAIERRSRVRDVAFKQGRSGPICLVTVDHEIWREGRCLVRERQDIVYLEQAAPSGGQPSPAASVPETRRDIVATPELLFRYSALTANSHRIHYDRTYAQEREGYRGLVVHGPLQAGLLANFVEEALNVRITGFSYRAISPLIDGTSFAVCLSRPDDRRVDCWTMAADGRTCMKAHARW